MTPKSKSRLNLNIKKVVTFKQLTDNELQDDKEFFSDV